jgi:hypothetical protein
MVSINYWGLIEVIRGVSEEVFICFEGPSEGILLLELEYSYSLSKDL